MQVLNSTLPIYLVMLIGYLAVRRRFFRPEHLGAFSRFVSTFALPALLFNALATKDPREIAAPTPVLTYALASLALIVLGVLWARFVWRSDLTKAAWVGMGCGGANSGFVGYALLSLVLPSLAAVTVGRNAAVENILLVPLVFFLAEVGQASGAGWHVMRSALVTMARSPILQSIAAGLLFSFLPWRLPVAITRTLDLFAGSCAVLAIFFAGGSLVGLSVRALAKEALTITTLKLLVHPLVMLGTLLLLEALGLPRLDGPARAALVLSGAMPMFSMWPIYSSRDGYQDLAAGTLALGTVCSFGTITVALTLMHTAGWL